MLQSHWLLIGGVFPVLILLYMECIIQKELLNEYWEAAHF